MVTVIIKPPDQAPYQETLSDLDRLTEILEGEFEMTTDDQLEGIVLLVNEEVRGIKPNNFTIQTDNFHDWVYGTCVFIGLEENSFCSLSEEQIQQVMRYFSA